MCSTATISSPCGENGSNIDICARATNVLPFSRKIEIGGSRLIGSEIQKKRGFRSKVQNPGFLPITSKPKPAQESSRNGPPCPAMADIPVALNMRFGVLNLAALSLLVVGYGIIGIDFKEKNPLVRRLVALPILKNAGGGYSSAVYPVVSQPCAVFESIGCTIYSWFISTAHNKTVFDFLRVGCSQSASQRNVLFSAVGSS